jgi:GTP-binding protein HflX
LYDPEENDLYDEFIALIESSGKEIVEIYTQERYPTSSHYFGRGFLERITEDFDLLEKLSEVNQAVISTQLSPLQYYGISEILPVEIMDKFELVLEIFEQRAHSQEAILQIELALLQYTKKFERNRLTSKVFSRFGTERRGFGATGQLKYAELISNYRAKESTIKQKLQKIQQDRVIQRKNRKRKADQENIFRIALAGYTNAGKSTLLNELTQAEVEVQDKMFTTLGTTTRRYIYKDLPVMITDTVGFIQDLPTTLIDAFRSTLEESLETDYVAVIVDISEILSEVERKVKTTLDVLHDLGVKDQHIWLILNKIDNLKEEDLTWIQEWVENTYQIYPHCFISAKKGRIDNIFKLFNQFRPAKHYQVLLPITMQKIRSDLYDTCEILKENYNNGKQLIQLDLLTRRQSTFLKLIKKAKKFDNNVSFVEIS